MAVVSFRGRGLKLDTRDDAQVIVDAISTCHLMDTLILEGNTLGIEAAEAIGEALQEKGTLRRALFKDLFTSRLKTEVPQALKHLLDGIGASGASLEELDLSDNAFGPIGAKELEPFLSSAACERLRILLLNNNGLGIQGGTLLAQALPLLPDLQILVCGRNRLENDASIRIGASLSLVTNLIELEMPQNGIRAEGITALSEAIRANEKLQVLNLNDNIITRKGAGPLGDALAACKRLRVLNLGDCLLRTAGGVRILRGLISVQPAQLSDLMLNGNELTGDEIVHLVSQLTSRIGCPPSLKVDLSCNNFGSLCSKLEQIDSATILLEDDEGSDVDEEEQEDEDEEEPDDVAKDIPKDASPVVDESLGVDDLCKLFVNVAIDGFDSKSGDIDSHVFNQSEKILVKAKEKSQSSYETTNALLTHMGLLKNEETRRYEKKDLRGPLAALAKCAPSLNQEEKQVLQVFLSNGSSESLEAAKGMKQKLLDSL